MANRKAAFLILLTLVLTLLFTSCAPKPEVLSDDEIAQLREAYPVVSDTYLSESIPFEHLWEYTAAIAVITATGDCFDHYSYTYIPFEINELLYNDGSFTEGDKVCLWFGMSGLVHSSPGDYKEGGRYLCFITKTNKTDVDDSPIYAFSKQGSAYVTDDDHILSMVGKGPFLDYTGYSLDSYKTALDSLIK